MDIKKHAHGYQIADVVVSTYAEALELQSGIFNAAPKLLQTDKFELVLDDESSTRYVGVRYVQG